MMRPKEITKERTKERTKEKTKEAVTVPYSSSADAMNEGVGKHSGAPPHGTQLLGLHPPLLFPLPALPGFSL